VLVKHQNQNDRAGSSSDHHDQRRPATTSERSLSENFQPSLVDLALTSPLQEITNTRRSTRSWTKNLLFEPNKQKQNKENKQPPPDLDPGGKKPPLENKPGGQKSPSPTEAWGQNQRREGEARGLPLRRKQTHTEDSLSKSIRCSLSKKENRRLAGVFFFLLN
jgi:hypothetical protein